MELVVNFVRRADYAGCGFAERPFLILALYLTGQRDSAIRSDDFHILGVARVTFI